MSYYFHTLFYNCSIFVYFRLLIVASVTGKSLSLSLSRGMNSLDKKHQLQLKVDETGAAQHWAGLRVALASYGDPQVTSLHRHHNHTTTALRNCGVPARRSKKHQNFTVLIGRPKSVDARASGLVCPIRIYAIAFLLTANVISHSLHVLSRSDCDHCLFFSCEISLCDISRQNSTLCESARRTVSQRPIAKPTCRNYIIAGAL